MFMQEKTVCKFKGLEVIKSIKRPASSLNINLVNYQYLIFCFSLQVVILFMASCVLMIANGCNGQTKRQITVQALVDTTIKGNFVESSGLVFDSTEINSFLKRRPAFNEFSADFKKFYSLRNFNYVWYDHKGVTESTNNLFNRLLAQNNDGILKSFPYKDDFRIMINRLQNGEAQKSSPETELMLTGEYFNYAKNSWGGAEVNNATASGWYLPKKKLIYSDLLKRQLNSPLDSVEQTAVIPQYLALKKALNQYQQIEKAGPDILVDYNKAFGLLKPGDTSAGIILLRKRLAQLGDLKQVLVDDSSTADKRYDKDLEQAIIRFKTRHGMNANLKLNASFFKQLTIPVHKRIEQMIINLERLRWIPVDDHGGEFILVNLPEYQLHYYIGNKLNWDCRVVVGKLMTQTVIFSGDLQYVIFSPYWNIPSSIIKQEIKPGIAKNPNYLRIHNMEWNGGRIRQKPGKNNSLGLVKFIFPNSNNIYLHDTPAKSLFNEDNRAFSHGCIRVAQPKELAKRLLKQLPAWTPEKIDVAMHAGNERTVVLKKKIPVYIGYFTAFVNSKGQLNFRDDIYDRDSRLLSFLMKD